MLSESVGASRDMKVIALSIVFLRVVIPRLYLIMVYLLMCLILWDIRFQSATIKVRILRKDLETLDFTIFFENDKLRTEQWQCRLINLGLH